MRKALLFFSLPFVLALVLSACIPSVSADSEKLSLSAGETNVTASLNVEFPFRNTALYVGGASNVVPSSPAFVCDDFNRGYLCTEISAPVEAGTYTFVVTPTEQPPTTVSVSVWFTNDETGDEFIVSGRYVE